MDTQAQLKVSGLHVQRGKRKVLHGIDLQVEDGQVVGLLGPNGSGKSSLLQALVGLLPAKASSVVLQGEATKLGSAQLRKAVGAVFQTSSLDDEQSAKANLLLAAACHGISAKQALPKITALLADTGFADRADEPVGNFSGGMRRRVDLLRALLPEPKLLLLDEPTTGLDPSAHRAFWQLLRKRAVADGVAVLVATHQNDDACQCDRLEILDAGRWVAQGSPKELGAKIGGDVVSLMGPDPKALEHAVGQHVDAPLRLENEKLVFALENAASRLLPILASLGEGMVTDFSVHTATVADIFYHLTGKSFAT